MALTAQQQNHISRLMQEAEIILDLQNRLQRLIAEWNQNDMFNQMDDAEIAAVFPHLTLSEVGNAINAITAVDTALGSYIGGQAVNLLKLRG